MEERDRVLNAALAGLLADPQIKQAIGPFIPPAIRGFDADRAVSAGRSARAWLGGLDGSGKMTRLAPVLGRVKLKEPAPVEPGRYRLTGLDVWDKAATFPTTDLAGTGQPWNGLMADLTTWQSQPGWGTQTALAFVTTVLALLRKHLWCLAADERAADVSLYEQLRLTSALAACVAPDNEAASDGPVALIVRGDLSGIQNFIYRITRPEAETEHVAKRLRGRSFYLSLLAEVTADWLLRELNLPPNCVLFAGGGRFDLLLPTSAQSRLTELRDKLDSWLLAEFQGELGLHLAVCEARPADLTDMRRVYQTLDERLERSKRQKWQGHFQDEQFFQPKQALWHVCRICQLTPLPEPGTCAQCAQHAHIGQHLPHATHLVYVYDSTPIDLPADQVIDFRRSPFEMRVAIVRRGDSVARLADNGGSRVVFQLNDAQAFTHGGTASSFRFLANAAPRALEVLHSGEAEPIGRDDVLHFEAIAELSTGAKRLGALKADVDLLGLVMSEGLSDDERPNGQRPTITRVAALSGALELFFAGHLNRICQEVAEEWQTAETAKADGHPLAEKVSGLFYVMYSGGDDLFVVGPWDQTLRLAERIRNEFAAFTGHNPNLTLSAGVVQVKPRYPTQKFAELADEAEKAAKNGGRNAITAFGQTVSWTNKPTFSDLLAFADRLTRAVEDNRVPRSLIADLGRLQRQHRDRDRALKPMWTPRLYYTLARRLNDETRKELAPDLIATMPDGKIFIPISIVSLITRKE